MAKFPLSASSRFLTLAALAFLLGGCSSIAQGVTQAVLEQQEAQEDKRACEIDGAPFDGIEQSLAAQTEKQGEVTKVLMIHGISAHQPGYSARFQKKLYEKLGLTETEGESKTIQLDSAQIAWKKGEPHELGALRVSRHKNPETGRSLVFYELTWSPITEKQKESVAADSANNEGLKRADLNGTLKSFLNSTVPDVLIYNGNGHERITTAVAESVCWMLADQWEALPKRGAHICESWPASTFSNLEHEDLFFITHSLGSRITLDMIQKFAFSAVRKPPSSRLRNVRAILRNKEIEIFMLANQLPLLQMGQSGPSVTEEQDRYCRDSGDKTNDRAVHKTNIVAFSDPNDILSYPVPSDFAEKRIDSRLCARITNVSLNVAEEKTLLDAVSFANPLTAHSGYMEDERVIDLIANGSRRAQRTPLIASRCKIQETQEPR